MMETHAWDWLLLQSPGSFAWLSGGGRSYIVDGDPRGVGLILVSQQSVHLLAANIELPRLPEEEAARTCDRGRIGSVDGVFRRSPNRRCAA